MDVLVFFYNSLLINVPKNSRIFELTVQFIYLPRIKDEKILFLDVVIIC